MRRRARQGGTTLFPNRVVRVRCLGDTVLTIAGITKRAWLAAQDSAAKEVVAADLKEAANKKASFLTLQALCRSEGLHVPNTVAETLSQACHCVAAVNELDRVKAEQDATETKRLSSQAPLTETVTNLLEIIGSR